MNGRFRSPAPGPLSVVPARIRKADRVAVDFRARSFSKMDLAAPGTAVRPQAASGCIHPACLP